MSEEKEVIIRYKADVDNLIEKLKEVSRLFDEIKVKMAEFENWKLNIQVQEES